MYYFDTKTFLRTIVIYYFDTKTFLRTIVIHRLF